MKRSVVTRRAALKLAGQTASVALAVPFINLLPAAAEGSQPNDPVPQPPPAALGRVANWTVDIREAPQQRAKLVRTAKRDELFTLREQIVADAVMPHNNVWYKIDEGYVYSSWIQPVEDVKNQPEPERAAAKFWGEITVPYSDSRWGADPAAGRANRLYYTGVFRVIAAEKGKDDQWWYRLQEGVTYSPGPWVPAAHIRRFDPSELSAISPEVTDKKITVDLKTQTMVAYENGNPVMTTRVASGYGSFRTPAGTHHVLFKNPTARMSGGVGSDSYDLPGVAFPTFITWSGVAIHGTYWHNDYGHPRSHGCLNVPSPVARWFWRWTSPEAPYEAASYYTPRNAVATTVVVA